MDDISPPALQQLLAAGSAARCCIAKRHFVLCQGVLPLLYLALLPLRRILKYSACSAECFVLALVYIDRLIQQHNLVLSTLNVHRVIITR